MKKERRHQIAAILAGLISLSVLSSSYAAGTTSAQFLKMGAGARAAAMGDTSASITDDVTATYWNAAGLAKLKTTEISVMHTSGLIGTQYQYMGAGLPLAKGALGFSLYRLDYGSIDRYTSADVKDGSFTAGALAGGVTYATEVKEGLQIGATAKFLQESIENEKGNGIAADLGAIYALDKYNLGLSVRNLGTGVKMVEEKFSLPMTVQFGASTNFLNDKLLVGLDISKAKDNDATYHAGVEYRVYKNIAMRGGYSVTPGNKLDVAGLTGLTAGLGMGLGSFNLDYAFVPFGDLGSTHRISLLMHIGQK